MKSTNPLLLCSLLLTSACAGPQGRLESGLATDGKLRPCPPAPNCVSSQAEDKEHFVEPLRLPRDHQVAIASLRIVLSDLPRTQIIADADDQLHAEVRSRIFRFIDDMELLIDRPAAVVHIRSASRCGYSDLGVNRARVEELRRRWKEEISREVGGK